MTKKEYIMPTMKTVLLKHRSRLLAGSGMDSYGMNDTLQDEEVIEGW